MTVGTTPTESGTTTPRDGRHPDGPHPLGGDPVTSDPVSRAPGAPPTAIGPLHPDGPVSPGPTGEHGGQGGQDEADPLHRSRVEGRLALREARKRRRRLSVVCALLVCFCLAVTVAIVSLARSRPSGPQVVEPALALAPLSPVRPVPVILSIPTPGAPAPQGGLH